MKLAIMQPYFMPYIGYFQIINAVDKFIFYDDVNFIKNGWINRNNIIINNTPKYITIQLKGASPNKLINEVVFTDNRNKIKKTIQMAYKKAPFFNDIWPMIEKILSINTQSISQQAIYSVKNVSEYLGIKTNFEISSEKYSHTKGIDRTDRILDICKINNASTYINTIAGKELYQKETFSKESIKLHFLRTTFTEYKQFKSEFISALSIIDVMMFNSIEEIRKMLNKYELV